MRMLSVFALLLSSATRLWIAQAAAGDLPPREAIDRGLIARAVGDGKVYLGWRLLATDPAGVAFNVYRQQAERPAIKLNAEPIRQTTDFVDSAAPQEGQCSWLVRSVVDGQEGPAASTPPTKASASDLPYVSIRLDGDYTFQKVGIADLDGDGRYDYVIKQPNFNTDPYYKPGYWKKSEDTYKLEAYRADGKFLWRHDLGWSIEEGIWYSPYLVYDLDGDGKAEVAVKTGEGDPRDKDGRVFSGPEYLTILDGQTGKPVTRIDWPSREGFAEGRSELDAYNYAARNLLSVAYLDGKTPSLIVQRGTYNIMKTIAYQYRDGKLAEVWRWDNTKAGKTYWGQGAHWMHSADVDGDGRDEVLLGSCVLDDDGKPLWTTGLGHPDNFYVGDIDPTRPGLEIYYDMETAQKQRNGMCLVEAATGKILWGYEGPTRHIHGQGMCSDIDAAHPGSECYGADTDSEKKFAWARLWSARGQVISEENLDSFSPKAAYWDADPQRELVIRGRIFDYGAPKDKSLLAKKVEGTIVAVADILGDWREEIVTSVAGELRIYTTTIPATDRRGCLMQDPIYRIDVANAAMGYFQVPMTSYDLATQRGER